MNENQMYEKSFQRPRNYFSLTPQQQWMIDKDLGILDWIGDDLTSEQQERFRNHYVNI